LTSMDGTRDCIDTHGFAYGEQVHTHRIPVRDLTGFDYIFPDGRDS